MSLPVTVCTAFAMILIWRLSCVFRARPMGMIVSWPIVLDLLATAVSVLSAGVSVHYVLNWDEHLSRWVLVPAVVSLISLVIAFVAAGERRRRGGEIYVHA